MTRNATSSRNLFGWYMYDWANSAYMTTVAAAFLPSYFLNVIAAEADTALRSDTMWAWTLSGSALASFLMAPVLGAIADFTGSRKTFLLIFAAAGSASTILLSLSGPGDVYRTLGLFMVSQVCFVSSLVFYDSFLTVLTDDSNADAISAKGYSYGYLGGGLQFALSLALFSFHDELGLSEQSAAQVAILMAGLWWAGFTLVTAQYLREPRPVTASNRALAIPQYISIGFSRIWRTLHRARSYRHLILFLLAYMVYNDGIQTVILMATPYGTDLGISTQTLMLTLLLTQILGAPGSMLFSRIAAIAGTKNTILTCLVLWTGVVVSAYFIEAGSGTQFMALGAVVGFVFGGSQALSRSYYSSMIPVEESAEFFGFFTVFSKFSSIWGTFVFGAATQAGGSTRPAILGTAVFFIAGLLLLSAVNERKARAPKTAETA